MGNVYANLTITDILLNFRHYYNKYLPFEIVNQKSPTDFIPESGYRYLFFL